MNEYLKERPEKAFLLFTKVYIYMTGTKKKWSELSQEEKETPGFRWDCVKMCFLSKNPLTEEQIINYIKTDTTELNEPPNTTNSKSIKNKKLMSLLTTKDYIIYGYFPLRACDVKVLLNTIGIRMLHFIDN